MKRSTLSAQRVTCPTRIAIQISIGSQRARLLDHEADAQRHDDLRDDRDVERALGVARALQPAGVGQRDGDEKTRDTEHPQKLDADLDDGRVVHAEEGQQLAREE